MKLHLYNQIVSAENKPIVRNFFSLGTIQVINFLLSIITLPYLIRVVGVEHFGLVTVAQTVMLYLTVVTDYGFNLSATKDISINRASKSVLSSTFSAVMAIKAVLLTLSAFVLTLFVIVIPGLKVYSILLLYSFPIVIGQVLQPLWFYQGIEKMSYITYTNIFTRTIYAIGVFIFVKDFDDYLLVNLINGISTIVGGVISLIIVYKKFNLEFIIPTIVQLKKQLENGWSIFVSTITVTISNNSNILILSIFASPIVLGYYSIAEKIFLIMRTLAVILYQVVYPRVCLLAQQPFEFLSKFLYSIFKLVLITFLPMALVTFFFADLIIYFISGEYHPDSAKILRVVCFAPLLAALNIPVAQTMLAFLLNKTYSAIVSVGALVNITLNFFLASKFYALGTASSILVTEAIVTGLLYIVLYKQYPQYSFLSRGKAYNNEA